MIEVRMIEPARKLPSARLSDVPGDAAAARRASDWLLTGAPSPTPIFSGDIAEAILFYINVCFQIDLIVLNRIAATSGTNTGPASPAPHSRR